MLSKDGLSLKSPHANYFLFLFFLSNNNNYKKYSGHVPYNGETPLKNHLG